MEFRTHYKPYKRTGTEITGQSKTKQSFKEECDINNILKLYKKTGILPDLIKANPQYGDFSNPVDYQEALNTISHAADQFSNLSAAVRKRFDNDPRIFLEFATNPKNKEEMINLGLAIAKPVAKPLDVNIVEKAQPEEKGNKK